MSKIRPAELDDRRQTEDVFVLDVRPRPHYQRRHIEGSVNAPVYDDLRSGDTAALDDYLDRIPSDRPVVTVCKAGVVARRATAYLSSKGREVETLAGGMRSWRHYEDDTLYYRLTSGIRSLLS